MLKHHLIINWCHLMDFLLFSWHFFLCCSHSRCFGEFGSKPDFDDINTSFNFSSISPLNETLLFLNNFSIFGLVLFSSADLRIIHLFEVVECFFQILSWHILVWNVFTTCQFFFISTVSYCCKMLTKYLALSTSAI